MNNKYTYTLKLNIVNKQNIRSIDELDKFLRNEDFTAMLFYDSLNNVKQSIKDSLVSLEYYIDNNSCIVKCVTNEKLNENQLTILRFWIKSNNNYILDRVNKNDKIVFTTLDRTDSDYDDRALKFCVNSFITEI